jgi:PIN domain
VASELTLHELTVRPLQLGRQDVADEYELLLSYYPNLDLEPVSKEVLLGAVALRARHRLRTPDSILLATGIRSSATAAITNDNGWKAAQGLGIEVILLSQLVTYSLWSCPCLEATRRGAPALPSTNRRLISTGSFRTCFIADAHFLCYETLWKGWRRALESDIRCQGRKLVIEYKTHPGCKFVTSAARPRFVSL